MSVKHLFCFGYESPAEFRLNSAEGSDLESSAAVWIVGAENAALEWGQAIAQQYVKWLFECAGAGAYSWEDACFANWVETDKSALATAESTNLLIVAIGEMPDFEALAS